MDRKTDYTVIIFNKMHHWLTHTYLYKFYVTIEHLTIHAYRITIFTLGNPYIGPPEKDNYRLTRTVYPHPAFPLTGK